METFAAAASANSQSAHSHGIGALQCLYRSVASVGHGSVDSAHAVFSGAGALTCRNGFVIYPAFAADQDVIHGARRSCAYSVGRNLGQCAQAHICYSLAYLHIASPYRYGRIGGN